MLISCIHPGMVKTVEAEENIIAEGTVNGTCDWTVYEDGRLHLEGTTTGDFTADWDSRP